jgi:prepilin-type N-terminal cleavage/methylation domain-containing protein
VRAFTLIELLIVVGVILILVSLVVSVGSVLVKRAERTQTERAMDVMDSALSSYEAALGRPLTYEGASVPLTGATFDIKEPAAPSGASGALATIRKAQAECVYAVNLLAQVDALKPMFAGLPADVLRPDKGVGYPAAEAAYQPSVLPRSELVDTWGNRFAIVLPGRPFRFGVDTGLPDPDGTVRTAIENVFGVCTNRRICLVSAGPDGVFGADGESTPNATPAQRLVQQADNLYLYDLDPPN